MKKFTSYVTWIATICFAILVVAAMHEMSKFPIMNIIFACIFALIAIAITYITAYKAGFTSGEQCIIDLLYKKQKELKKAKMTMTKNKDLHVHYAADADDDNFGCNAYDDADFIDEQFIIDGTAPTENDFINNEKDSD